jgi:hypothetical protein
MSVSATPVFKTGAGIGTAGISIFVSSDPVVTEGPLKPEEADLVLVLGPQGAVALRETLNQVITIYEAMYGKILVTPKDGWQDKLKDIPGMELRGAAT